MRRARWSGHSVLVFLVHGQDQHGQLGHLLLDLLDQRHATLARHRQIEQHEIDLAFPHMRDDFLPVGAPAATTMSDVPSTRRRKPSRMSVGRRQRECGSLMFVLV